MEHPHSPTIEMLVVGLPGLGKSTLLRSLGAIVEIDENTRGLSDTSKTAILATPGGMVVDTPGYPDNRKKPDGSPLYTVNDIKKGIICTTAEGGYNLTRHVVVHLPGATRTTDEMYDSVKFAKDYVNGNSESVQLLVTAPQSAKFLEAAETIARDLGIPNAPVSRYLDVDHVPNDIAATGRYVVLRNDDPKTNFEILKEQFAKVEPVTTAAHNTRCKNCNQVCDPRCMEPCHKGPIVFKHGNTHITLEHPAIGELHHDRMVRHPPAALRAVEGLLVGWPPFVPSPMAKILVAAGSVGTMVALEQFGGATTCDNCGRTAADQGCIVKYPCCNRGPDEIGCEEVIHCEHGHKADEGGCMRFCQHCKRDPAEPGTGCDKYGQVEHDLERI